MRENDILLIDWRVEMAQSAQPKTNALMNLFLKREPSNPLPLKKPTKKVKTSDDKFNDPLYQILGWRDDIKPHPIPCEPTCRSLTEAAICSAEPSRWGSNLQGILINIDWNATPMENFSKLTLSNELLSNGMVFIWGSKTNIGQLMDRFDEMGYTYAENFTFVLLSRSKIPSKTQKQLAGNKSLHNFFAPTAVGENAGKTGKKEVVGKSENDYEIGRVEDPSQIFLDKQSEYFCESQKVLYMFRKINKKEPLELRHQRTSDVFFTIGEGMELDWKAKEVVYRMIETLLIQANYKQKQPLRLLELWAQPGYQRKGWISVTQDPSLLQEKL